MLPRSNVHFLHPLHERVSPDRWCITRRDLDVFEREVRELWAKDQIPDNPQHPNQFHEDPEVGPSIYQVTKFYIKPLTLQFGGMSWALMRNSAGLPCDIFVSHSWAEGAFEFCSKLKRMWPFFGRHLYCCFLANPQNGDMSELLGGDVMCSPFAKALLKCTYFLVLPNRRVSVYTRLWCVFEAHMAIENGCDIRMLKMPLWKHFFSTMFRPLPAVFAAFSLMFLFKLKAESVQISFAELDIGFGIVLMLTAGMKAECLDHFLCCSSLFTLAAYAISGFLVWVLFVGPGHNPFENVVFLCIWMLLMMQMATAAQIAKALRAEGNQLEFDTVSNAECSHEGDEQRIRARIGGQEYVVDRIIDILKRTGRYDSTIRIYLEAGLTIRRVRDGPLHCQWVASWNTWLHLFLYLPAFDVDFRMRWGPSIAYAMMLGGIMLATIAHFLGVRGYFLSDVHFWCSWVAMMYQNFVDCTTTIAGPIYVLNMSVYAVYVACIATAVWRCCVFYSSVDSAGLESSMEDESSDGSSERTPILRADSE